MSFELGKRAIESIKNQTYKNYKLFLIGDKYEKKDEFNLFGELLDKNKIYLENLKVAAEREKYKGRKLWVTGGTNASNIAIDRALSENFSWISFLDYDDIYYNNHLEVINKAIIETNSNFISTLSWQGNNESGRYLPELNNCNDYYNNYKPLVNHLSKISVCFNINHYNFKFRNMIEQFNIIYASDGDLWDQINIQMENKSEYGILINELTCQREIGKTVIRKPEIV